MGKKKKTIKKYQKLIFKSDPFYGSYWMAKFSNKFMKSGKKHAIERATFNAFSQIRETNRKVMLNIFLIYLMKFRPLIGFISKRFGKKFKKIPVPLYPRRQTVISLKWLVTSIKVNREKSFQKRLVSEFGALHKNQKTPLAQRYTEHVHDVIEHRLNHRFRWK